MVNNKNTHAAVSFSDPSYLKQVELAKNEAEQIIEQVGKKK